MPWMPDVARRPLPENEAQPSIHPTQLIVHTAVDHGLDIPSYFGRESVRVESHFWLMADGVIVQMIDSAVQADANYTANKRAISVETEDGGRPLDPWTDAQVDSLRQIIRWANATHQIPIERCLAHDASGVGWHSMWSYPDDPIGLTGRPVSSPWTTSFGKTCPGQTRIGQLLYQVAPGMNVVDEVPYGTCGPQVVDLQRAIGATVDGEFGPLTAATIKGWQVANNLRPTGAADPQVRRQAVGNEPRLPLRPQKSSYLTQALQADADDPTTIALLDRVNDALGVSAQVGYGDLTRAAVVGFQTGCGLTVDGIVGPWTWGTLFIRPTTTLDTLPHNLQAE